MLCIKLQSYTDGQEKVQMMSKKRTHVRKNVNIKTILEKTDMVKRFLFSDGFNVLPQ